MRHSRHDVARLRVDGTDHPVARGDLVVVAHDGTDALDWEAVVTLLGATVLAPQPYAVELDLLDGRTVRGDAVLVRSAESTHVLRGVTGIEGIDDAELA